MFDLESIDISSRWDSKLRNISYKLNILSDLEFVNSSPCTLKSVIGSIGLLSSAQRGKIKKPTSQTGGHRLD